MQAYRSLSLSRRAAGAEHTVHRPKRNTAETEHSTSARRRPTRHDAMLPYATAAEAEAALGRALTWAEAAWLRYSAAMPDRYLHWPNIAITLVVYTLAPLPLALLDLGAPAVAAPYKLQPKVQHPPATFFRCYMDAVRVSLLLIGPYQLISYPAAQVSYFIYFLQCKLIYYYNYIFTSLINLKN